MSNMTTFKPTPGYLLCKPYIDSEKTFQQLKESPGDLQRSEVVGVGASYTADKEIQKSPAKKGDMILHRYTSNTGTIGFSEIRAIHFTEVFGIQR